MDFKKNKSNVYPWIKRVYQPDEEPPKTSNEMKLSKEDYPVYQEWLGGLAIFYAVDEGSHFNLILNRDMPANFTTDELHEIAVENLNRDIEFKFNETVFGGYGLISGGDHEAGAICLDGIWHWCAEQLKDNLVVAVAAKDMVLMVPASDKDKINELKKFVDKLFEDGERLLTKQFFLFDVENNAWSELEEAINKSI